MEPMKLQFSMQEFSNSKLLKKSSIPYMQGLINAAESEQRNKAIIKSRFRDKILYVIIIVYSANKSKVK